MAYYLNSTASSNKVAFSQAITLSSVGDYFELDFEMKLSHSQIFGLSSGYGQLLERTATDIYRFRVATTGTIRTLSPPKKEGRFKLRIQKVAGGYELFQDDISAGVFSDPSSTFSPNQLLAWVSDSVGGEKVYGLKVWNSGSLVHNYDPSASNGIGSILPDTVGGNDGTLVSFPTDGSQWVFYDAPTGNDVDSTVSATWPSLAISATQQSTAPAIESSVNFTWPALTIAANQTAQAPEFSSTVAAQWPSLSVSANQSATAPVFDSTVSLAWPSFTVQASQGAQVPDVDSIAAVTWPALSVTASQASTLPAYDSTVAVTWPSLSISATQSQQLPEGATTVNVTWPSLSVSASQASTVPSFESAGSFTWPSLSVSVTQVQELPTGGASVSVQWPSLSVTAEQQSTIPEYTATIAATWPMFSVSILAGEFDYFNDPTARIDLPFESRRIDLPFESRRIDL